MLEKFLSERILYRTPGVYPSADTRLAPFPFRKNQFGIPAKLFCRVLCKVVDLPTPCRNDVDVFETQKKGD